MRQISAITSQTVFEKLSSFRLRWVSSFISYGKYKVSVIFYLLLKDDISLKKKNI